MAFDYAQYAFLTSLLSWLPTFLIVGVVVFLMMRITKRHPTYQKEYLALLQRQVEALERIEKYLDKH